MAINAFISSAVSRSSSIATRSSPHTRRANSSLLTLPVAPIAPTLVLVSLLSSRQVRGRLEQFVLAKGDVCAVDESCALQGFNLHRIWVRQCDESRHQLVVFGYVFQFILAESLHPGN